jgi:hypothetical protein
MQLSELQSLVGSLTNDPNHDRYVLADINLELDNSQDKWNVEARILKDTVTLTTVDGTSQYALSSLTGTPIAFTRATHKGLPLNKRDKSYFDLYMAGDDWSVRVGTPVDYYIETSNPSVQYLNVFPIPQSADAGNNLTSEYIKRHTPMSADTDSPFDSSPLTSPYHYGLAYDASSRLLLRDPNQVNAVKVGDYRKIADDVLASVVQTYKALERQEPYRLRGGRVF